MTTFPGFPDFESIQRRNDRWRDFAKSEFMPGVDPADLKSGMKVTISPNLMIHDRSYTREIHEVLAVNSTHVQTKIKSYDRPILLPVHEHHFYDASGFQE